MLILATEIVFRKTRPIPRSVFSIHNGVRTTPNFPTLESGIGIEPFYTPQIRSNGGKAVFIQSFDSEDHQPFGR